MHRLIPVFLGFRVESTQSGKPYLAHLSHGLRRLVSRARTKGLNVKTHLVFEHLLQAF